MTMLPDRQSSSGSESRATVAAKPPRALWEEVYAFPPNRGTLGGTAYLIVKNYGNIAIDSPPWTEATREFLHAQGGVRWLFLTHRGGTDRVAQMQQEFGCQAIVQEQEAYLLPEVELTTFERELELGEECRGIWTCGHSPGSSCLYYGARGGILFSGRHLLPTPEGKSLPLRTAKTFHWRRQLRSVAALRDRFSEATLAYICPGANTGFLRGRGAIAEAYSQLAAIPTSL